MTETGSTRARVVLTVQSVAFTTNNFVAAQETLECPRKWYHPLS